MVNFTLLPLTDVDAEVLTIVLGQVPMVIRSEGYGSCRVFATGLRRVWAVQYLNSMGRSSSTRSRSATCRRLGARRARGLRGFRAAPGRDPGRVLRMNSRFEGSYMGDASKLDDDARLECGICWWVYDPVVGDDVAQVAPGTPFAQLPDTWRCPNCDAEKPKFMVIGSVMGATRELDAVTRLVNFYRHASINMKGLPIYNPTLAVEAIGFREHDGAPGRRDRDAVVHEPDGAGRAARTTSTWRRGRDGAARVPDRAVRLRASTRRATMA